MKAGRPRGMTASRARIRDGILRRAIEECPTACDRELAELLRTAGYHSTPQNVQIWRKRRGIENYIKRGKE
jgi:hypothetical protein